MAELSSVPGFGEFTPEPIPWQDDALDEILNYDYGLGAHEVLFSGSYGSAKTILVAHIICIVCLKYPHATVLISRRTLTDLRDTLYKKICDHLRNDDQLIEGVHYWCTDSTCTITFANGSKVIARTWHDGQHTKVRSLDLTMAVFEEAIELDRPEDWEYYIAVLARLGRTLHIPIALSIMLTNPGDPEHKIYEHFYLDLDEDPESRYDANITARPPTRHVYYSLTEHNIFLPKWYIPSLMANTDPEELERVLRGRWRAIRRAAIYHQYVKAYNYIPAPYEIVDKIPIRFSWDFNIGEGKPMSVSAAQYDESKDTFHFFKDYINHSFRTQDSFDAIADTGILDVPGRSFILHGDAAGKHKDTRNNQSDWDILRKCFADYRTPKGQPLNFSISVPLSNPRIRFRHNRVNAYLCNGLGERRLFVYKGAEMIDKGLRLTKLLSRDTFKEDDSQEFQHVSTTIGYLICSVENETKLSKERKVVNL